MINFNYTIFLLAPFLLFHFSLFSQSHIEKDALYIALLENDRMLKDQKFSQPSVSPLSDSRIKSFNGLDYFEVDTKYRFFARINRNEIQTNIALQTTSEEKIELLQYGTITFSFEGTVYNLAIFRDQNLPELSENPGQLFIPFKDKTNGTETYENGRIINIKLPRDGEDTEIDFNKAFNPNSAYNSRFKSIIAPEINNLPFPLYAGEKVLR
ncbi:MAG: DUF1684 domain-containing protein [Bacteroidales bacterium]|nr:DUF1684 domain-containing protein [Bacteroidales bacterium]MCF8403725.1 DUF1684 domain-containing protein [Bacteroidales bacterium]